MTEVLKRDDMVELLQSLGSDQDEEVLAAARELHALVVEAGAAWEDLLAVEVAAGGHSESAEPPAQASETNAETLALINKLLARPGISDDFRDEMNGYKSDIAEGVFEEADRGYIRALYKRLKPKG